MSDVFEELRAIDAQISALKPIANGADDPYVRYVEIAGDWPDTLADEDADADELRKSAERWSQAASDAFTVADRLDKIQSDANDAQSAIDGLIRTGNELAEASGGDYDQMMAEFEWLS